MEKEGIVSIWAGTVDHHEALMAYAAEAYYNDEGNAIVSPFSRDFFGGILWPFDPDFWERAVIEPTADPKALVCNFSYGDSVGESLRKYFPKGLGDIYNAAILVYDYDYDGAACNPNAPVKFLAAVPYEKTSDTFSW